MQTARRNALWILAWCVITALGCIWLARTELDRLRADFETDARIAHRLLSQRAVQQDAVLAMLTLLQPANDSSQPEQRLPSVYPQILSVQRRDPETAWSDEGLRSAEARSRLARRPVMTSVNPATGAYVLVLGADPVSYAVRIDVRSMVPWSEWPMVADTSPVRASLEYEGQSFVLHPGRITGGGWQFEFRKALAAESQPFDVVAVRRAGWSELPWGWMSVWALAVAGALAALRAIQRQGAERRRAEELLRLGQVARLNTLGELAAGMAHELNQPLTAVLANTSAASRLLSEDPPELGTARVAMTQAAEQARRASDVVSRMRRAVERPDAAARVQPVNLEDAARNALYLLEPEFRRRSVAISIESRPLPVTVLAEPVALEQIVHNLLTNALQALGEVPAAERELTVIIDTTDTAGVLTVRDSGPGIPADALPRIFEPFFTTRSGGLGLGLSLCETLVTRMGGALAAANRAPRGAQISLTLPLAAQA